MLVSDVFELAIKAILDRKLRSALTIVGIMIGAAVIVALIASSNGLSAGISASMGKIGANTLVVNSATSFFNSGSGSSYQLSQNDIRTLVAISGVSEVIPYYSTRGTVTVGGTAVSAEIEGIDLSKLPDLYKGIALSGGAYPSQTDITSAAIGSGIAAPTGASVTIGVNQMVSVSLSGGGSSSSTLSFLVKGILAPYGSVLFSNIDDTVFIGMQTAQLFLKTPYYSGFYVITTTANDVSSVQTAIENQYGSNVRVMNAGSIASSVSSISSEMTVFLGAIGGVSLFVAAVGITNTMFVSVVERTREIGVLKALGYRSGQILSIFLSEAVITGAIGGVLGTILGYFLSFLIGGYLPMSGGPMMRSGASTEPVFTASLIVFALLFPVAISVLAGLYPARRASRMNAVVALKYE